MSFTRVVVLALALTHAVGLAEQVRRDNCEEECRDDGCEDDCTPGDTSTCCCHSGIAQLLGVTHQIVAKLELPIVVATLECGQRVHESPDPRAILHVPKRTA